MKALKYVSLWGAQGYADAAEAYVAALAARGVPLTWHPLRYYGQAGGLGPVGEAEVAGHPLRPLYHQPVDYDTVLFHVIPHAGLRARLEDEAGARRLIYTTWETDRLPANWAPLLNDFDAALVPSALNRQVFTGSGVRVPVYQVPHLPTSTTAGVPLTPPLPADRFIFYAIGEWTQRKAFADLLAAYWRAFTAADPVLLVIKTTPLDLTLATNRRGLRRLWRWAGTTRLALARQLLRQQRRRPGPLAPVRLIGQHLPAAVIEGLHSRGDCFVSLARGEGWGLGAYAAAARGKPIISTGWGGHLDFLPPDLGYLVNHQLVPARAGAYEAQFTPDQHWAQADLAHAAALLRQVFTQRAEAQARGRALAKYFGAHFAPEAITDRLLQALDGAP